MDSNIEFVKWGGRKRHGKLRHRWEESIQREIKGIRFEDVICKRI